VLLSEQAPTPYDLKFRLFGTHVRVHPFFWLTSAFLGWNAVPHGPLIFIYLPLWVACVFFSILLHEFGHVWMGQIFGVRSHIVLQAMCGLAIPDHEPYNRWRRIAISLAGPGIQLAFYGLLLLGTHYFPNPGRAPSDKQVATARAIMKKAYELEDEAQTAKELGELDRAKQLRKEAAELHSKAQDELDPGPSFVWEAISNLLWINLYWPLFNLLPVWPLDGGRVSRELFAWRSRNNGIRYSLILSIVVAAILAVNSAMGEMADPPFPRLPRGGYTFALFFGLLAYMSYQLLQQENAGRNRWGYEDSRWS
jgi:Zn-dependent protease